jgi:hydroxypyruvate isomerase
MPRLSANLSFLFTELPFLDRFAAAAAAGFAGVEWMGSYDIPPAIIRERLDAHGLEPVLINTPIGDWSAGDRGLAGQPGRIAEARQHIATAIDYAAAIGCRRIHVMAGMRDVDFDRAEQIATMVANLRDAADRAAAHGITLLVEPLNRKIDMPLYLLSGSEEGMEIVERVGRDNVRLQYDVYHMQIMEGDLARTIERLLPWIGHIQIADHPGRHEPGTGEIGYAWLLGRIDALGYDGWVGCEYRPAAGTEEGLGWAAKYLWP